MIRLHRYVLRQLVFGLLAVTFGLAAIIWLSQSLRFVELVVDRGLSMRVFVELTILMVPSFVAAILPVTVFIVVLLTYNRLASDRELTAMRNAGLSQWGLARPALWLAAAAGLLGLLLNLVVVPRTYEAFRAYQWEIRTRIAAVLLQEGVFNRIGDDMTVFIRARDRDGTLRGILVHDSRDKDTPVTVVAQAGRLAVGANGPRVTLTEGLREELDRRSGRSRSLSFAENTIDLARGEVAQSGPRDRDMRERSLGELVNPSDRATLAPREIGRFRAEAHQRLSQPFATVSYAMVALAAVLAGAFRRQGAGFRLGVAVGSMLVLVASALLAGSLAARSPAAVPLIWLSAILPGLVAARLLADSPQFWPRFASRPRPGLRPDPAQA